MKNCRQFVNCETLLKIVSKETGNHLGGFVSRDQFSSVTARRNFIFTSSNQRLGVRSLPVIIVVCY